MLGSHGNQLDLLTQSRWDTRPSRLTVAPGILVTRVTLSIDQGPGGKRRERESCPIRGQKESVRGGGKGWEQKVAQTLSLKLFPWELPWVGGTMAQYLQDPVVTVRVKSTSCQHKRVHS